MLIFYTIYYILLHILCDFFHSIFALIQTINNRSKMTDKQNRSETITTVQDQTWFVDKIVPDFELLDRWDIQLETKPGKPEDLNTILEVIFSKNDANDLKNHLTEFLFWFRGVLGKWFGWDKEVNTLPIPGCRECSLKERLKDFGIKQDSNQNSMDLFSDDDLAAFQTVYSLQNEKLLELSNNTVHGLMHYGLVKQGKTQLLLRLSVYVKTRGKLGRFYMKLITPFRHLIVYPTLIKNSGKNWENYCNR